MHMRLAALSAALLLMGAGCFGSANVGTNVEATPEGTTTVVENNDDDARMMEGCHFEDKNLCKFWTSWQASADMTVRMTTTGKDGKISTVMMELDGESRSHMSMTGPDGAFESINIDATTYVKGEDGVWTKFGSGTPMMDAEAPSKNEGIHFDLDDEDTSKTTFVAMGTEACGNLTCFKYEIIESGMGGRQYVWFDTKEYKLRKTQYEDAELGVTVAEYTYGDVNITVPSPVKELTAPNLDGMTQAEIEAMLEAQFGAEAGN
jgi:outer membrane lipoprotein-sorting protein